MRFKTLEKLNASLIGTGFCVHDLDNSGKPLEISALLDACGHWIARASIGSEH